MCKYAEKKVIFFGDSICEAVGDDRPRYGWPGRIGESLKPGQCCNAGISGASVSTVRGANRVLSQVERAEEGYDVVILHGGVNDAWDIAPVGKISDGAPEEFDAAKADVKTFAGGLEELLHAVKIKYPGAVIGYIINFGFVSEYGKLAEMDGYVAETIKGCEKWGISYLDLFHDEALKEALDIGSGRYAQDGIHPNAAGYDLLIRWIEPYVASLLDKAD